MTGFEPVTTRPSTGHSPRLSYISLVASGGFEPTILEIMSLMCCRDTLTRYGAENRTRTGTTGLEGPFSTIKVFPHGGLYGNQTHVTASTTPYLIIRPTDHDGIPCQYTRRFQSLNHHSFIGLIRDYQV